MKKLIMICSCLLICSFHGLNAQNLLVKSGLNLARWSGDDVETSKNKIGLQLGLIYELPVGEKSNFQFGLRYSQRGFYQKEVETLDFTDDIELKVKDVLDFSVNYLDVPLALKYKFNETIYGTVNGSASFHLSNNVKFTSTQCVNGVCTGESEEMEFDDIRSLDLNLGFGIGVKLLNNVFLEGSYQHGLLSLDNEGDSDAFNRNFILSVVYQF